MQSTIETAAYVLACWIVPVGWGAAIHFLFEYGAPLRRAKRKDARTSSAAPPSSKPTTAAEAAVEAADDSLIEYHL